MRRGSASGIVGLASALAVALLPLLVTWTPLVKDPTELVLAGTGGLVVLVAAALVRLARLPEGVAVLAGIIALAAWLAWLGSGYGGVQRLVSLFGEGIRRMQISTAPVPAGAGVTVVLCVAVGLLVLVADWTAFSLRRPLGVLGPMLLLLLVPVLIPKVHAAPVQGAALFAIGTAALLLASGDAARWRPGLKLLTLLGAASVTVVALVATLVLAPLVPVPPSLRGPDGEPIQMNDLSLDLRRQIARGNDTPAFDYTTSDGRDAYLRLYSLPTFDAGGWHLTNSSVQSGPLTAPPGLSEGTPRKVSVTVTGLRSEWLPAPYAPVSTTAGDRWGFLPDSLAILALGIADRKSATVGMKYTVDSLDARPTPEQLAAAEAAPPPDADITASVPSDISPTLVRLAGQITGGAKTPGAKVQAILKYLASPGFSYTLDAAPGSGYAGLEAFLLRDRKGFCVQYAASAAILARISGVPSRIAIGFTPGKRVGDHWAVTMHDMHAWPEVYLDGWGWVALEPTPGVGSNTASGTPDAPTPDTPAPTSRPSTSAAPRTPVPTAAPQAGDTSNTSVLGLAALIGLGVIALGAAPFLVRQSQRRLRLRAGRSPSVVALDAFAEIRSTAQDFGRPWPTSSPRFAAEEAASWVSAEVGEGVRRAGVDAERALFGGPDFAPAPGDRTLVVKAFNDDLRRGTPSVTVRLKAALLPASLWS